MLIIRKARFVTSLDGLKPFEGQGMPEVALAGKSNVGKSSMINRVTGNGKLARTSSEPGPATLTPSPHGLATGDRYGPKRGR